MSGIAYHTYDSLQIVSVLIIETIESLKVQGADCAVVKFGSASVHLFMLIDINKLVGQYLDFFSNLIPRDVCNINKFVAAKIESLPTSNRPGVPKLLQY